MHPNTTLICATAGRHLQLERVVRCFIDQDYKGDHLLLIYNNSEVEQRLDTIKLPRNKRILLVNNNLDRMTGKAYRTLGAIYRDALQFVPATTQVVAHADNDDTYLPDHVSEGVAGYLRAKEQGKVAYKPFYSYYRSMEGVSRVANNMEPSIFLDYEFLLKYGYSDTTADQHLQWLNPLVQQDKIHVEIDGKSTFIYHWNGEEGVFKTSGDPQNPVNFSNCRKYSDQHGDGIITPAPADYIKQYYAV